MKVKTISEQSLSVIASIMALGGQFRLTKGLSRFHPQRCWGCYDWFWIMPWTYIVCGECGHPYTKRSLVNDDLAVRKSLAVRYDPMPPAEWPYSPELVEPRKPEDIWICPCCAHDF